jgi:hypothetical protein
VRWGLVALSYRSMGFFRQLEVYSQDVRRERRHGVRDGEIDGVLDEGTAAGEEHQLGGSARAGGQQGSRK